MTHRQRDTKQVMEENSKQKSIMNAKICAWKDTSCLQVLVGRQCECSLAGHKRHREARGGREAGTRCCKAVYQSRLHTQGLSFSLVSGTGFVDIYVFLIPPSDINMQPSPAVAWLDKEACWILLNTRWEVIIVVAKHSLGGSTVTTATLSRQLS